MKKIKRKMCKHRKVGYITEVYALTRADRFSQKFHRTYRVYLCPDCDKWHLTTKVQTGAL